jgi:hypothetical protein
MDEDKRKENHKLRGKIATGSAQGGKTDKITNLGRKHDSKDLDKFM